MSTRETTQCIESLEVDDEVTVEDASETSYTGRVVERQRDEKERRWLVKGTNNTDDHVLHVYYDIEGRPEKAEISFENGQKFKLQSAKTL